LNDKHFFYRNFVNIKFARYEVFTAMKILSRGLLGCDAV